MTHTYSQNYSHIVWSTKKRIPYITHHVKNRLYAYMRTFIKEKKGLVIALNGMPDHIHLLISHKVTLYIPDFLKELKSASTKFVQTKINECPTFGWQEGYGCFSIGVSTLDRAVAYINNQEQHHAKKTFEEEYISFLAANHISYDPRFVFD